MKIISEEELDSLDSLADWMDSRFAIPGTNIRFGLDAILGIIPVVGDSVTAISTMYFIGVAHQYKLPWHVKTTMIWNLFIDWLIGLIPMIGDIFDVGWKANKKNVGLIKKYVGRADHIQVVQSTATDNSEGKNSL